MTSKKNNVNTTSLPNEQELLSNYENPNYPYSFASKKTVYKYFPHLDKKVIDKTLLKSNIHTSFKKYRKPKQYLPIYVHGKRELFQMDIIYMDGRKVDNNGYSFILSIIDCWSKFAWCFPMKKISAAGVVKHLRQLFSNPNNIPKKINSDRGVEFTAKVVKTFMTEMKILHTFSFSLQKAAFVERFNQTFQSIVAREMKKENIIKKWIDKVEGSLFKYNYVNTHSFIKMTPADGEKKENQKKISLLFKNKYDKIKTVSPLFSVGDIVKIFVDKGKFPRSYKQDFTDENFVVNKVFTNLPKPRYELRDFNNEIILGNFGQAELSLFRPS